jgi:hypothetical protein
MTGFELISSIFHRNGNNRLQENYYKRIHQPLELLPLEAIAKCNLTLQRFDFVVQRGVYH